MENLGTVKNDRTHVYLHMENAFLDAFGADAQASGNGRGTPPGDPRKALPRGGLPRGENPGNRMPKLPKNRHFSGNLSLYILVHFLGVGVLPLLKNGDFSRFLQNCKKFAKMEGDLPFLPYMPV